MSSDEVPVEQLAEDWIAAAYQEVVTDPDKLETEEDHHKARALAGIQATRNLARFGRSRQAAVMYLLSLARQEHWYQYLEGNQQDDVLVEFFQEIIQIEIENGSIGSISEWNRILQDLIPAMQKNGLPLSTAVEGFFSGKSKLRYSASHLTFVINNVPEAEQPNAIMEMMDMIGNPQVTINGFTQWSMDYRNTVSKATRLNGAQASVFITPIGNIVFMLLDKRELNLIQNRVKIYLEDDAFSIGSPEYMLRLLAKAYPETILRIAAELWKGDSPNHEFRNFVERVHAALSGAERAADAPPVD